MLMKTHKLTKEDIQWIKNTGMGGRKGYLKQILPLQQDGIPLQNPGPKIAQELHTTPQTRKNFGIKTDYIIFEVMLENNKVGFYFWSEDEFMAKNIMETYRTCYPSVGFQEQHEKFFINLEANDYVTCARLIPKYNRYLPINTVLNGEIWQNILSQIKSEDTFDKAVIQIILWPKNRSKMNKLHSKVRKRKDVKNPTVKYAEITNLWDAKAYMAPYEVVFRIVVLGRDSNRVRRKMGNLLGVFNRLDIDAAGNKFKRKIYSTHQVRFLNAVEDRDVKHFVGPVWNRFILSTDEVGHNFFAIPASEEVDILPVLDSMKVERLSIPEELIQRSSETKPDIGIDKKYMVTLRYDGVMTDEELIRERVLYEQRRKENEEKARVLNVEQEAYFNMLQQRIIDVQKRKKTGKIGGDDKTVEEKTGDKTGRKEEEGGVAYV